MMNPKFLKHFIVWSFVFVSGNMYAQDPRTMTLKEAIDYALEHSAVIKEAKLNIEDAEEQVIERRAIGLPQLNSTLDYTYYYKVPISVLPEQFALLAKDPNTGQVPDDFSREVQFSLKHNFTAGMRLNTLVFDGSYLIGLKAAKLYREYVQQELLAKKQEVRSSVVDAYLPSLIITENISTLDKNIANLEKLLFETKELYKAGFVEQLDVDRLELSLANLRVERENLTRQMQVAIEALKFSIGYPLEKELVITDDIYKLLLDATEEELSNPVNYLNRFEYKVAQLGVELNHLNVDLNRAGYLPNLSAFGSYEYAFQGNNLDKTGFWSPIGYVGAQINIPIFDGGDKKAKIQRAKVARDIAVSQIGQLEKLIAFETKSARTNYLNAKERVKNQKRTLGLAEKIYEITRIKYKEGVGSSIEMTQAEQSLYQTQQNYTQALYDMLVAKSALNKALGK